MQQFWAKWSIFRSRQWLSTMVLCWWLKIGFDTSWAYRRVPKHEKYLSMPATVEKSKQEIFGTLHEHIWRKTNGYGKSDNYLGQKERSASVYFKLYHELFSAFQVSHSIPRRRFRVFGWETVGESGRWQFGVYLGWPLAYKWWKCLNSHWWPAQHWPHDLALFPSWELYGKVMLPHDHGVVILA